MSRISLKATEIHAFCGAAKYPATLLEISIDGEVCSPEDLWDLEIPEIDHSIGVILSGKAPIWVFGALVHLAHVSPWLSSHDPRLSGSVVVSTHALNVPPIGSIVRWGADVEGQWSE